MRIDLKSLLDKLGVKRELHPYETQPWLHYDEEKGITCSAEVRMGPGSTDLEAEVQFLKDETDDDETEGDGDNEGYTGPDQVLHMRAEPTRDGIWSPKGLRVKGKTYTNEVSNWEEKGCNIFKACIQSIQMGELPEIDDLVAKELADDKMGGGRRGRVGRKSPKVKPGALMGGMKK